MTNSEWHSPLFYLWILLDQTTYLFNVTIHITFIIFSFELMSEGQDFLHKKKKTCTCLWLAKCCKIQQLGPSYSTTYIYFQQHIFIFNILYLYSMIRIFFQLQPNLFSFNKNICSTSTKNNFIQQKYLFNFNRK